MNADVLPAADAATQAAARVRVPAIIQIVLWALSALSALYGLINAMTGVNVEGLLAPLRKVAEKEPNAQQMLDTYQRILELYAAYALPMAVVGLVIALLGLLGSIRMLQLKTYSLAIIAAVLTLLPCAGPCCCFGLPIGIWSLVVLCNAQVRQQFT